MADPAAEPPAPRVSVVIPAWDAGAFLAEACRSALAQEPAPAEVLVVDDGSTDGSVDAVRTLPGVRVLPQARAGAAAARNRGVDAAGGTHLAFLDADDLWLPGALARLTGALARDPAVHGASGGVEVFSDASYGGVPAPLPAGVQGLLFGSFVLRRDDFLRVGPFSEGLRAGELLDWCARAREAGVRFVHLDEVVLRRRLHARNSVHDRARLSRAYAEALRAKRTREREAGGV